MKGDVLVIMGDVCSLNAQFSRVNDLLDWCSRSYKQTYILIGNEDYYDGLDISDTLDGYCKCLLNNVMFVNNTSIILDDTEIFFTTLWKSAHSQDISDMLVDRADFEKIICHGRPLTVETMSEIHKICIQWLFSALVKSTTNKRIIVTHHCIRDEVKKQFLLFNVDEIHCNDDNYK